MLPQDDHHNYKGNHEARITRMEVLREQDRATQEVNYQRIREWQTHTTSTLLNIQRKMVTKTELDNARKRAEQSVEPQVRSIIRGYAWRLMVSIPPLTLLVLQLWGAIRG